MSLGKRPLQIQQYPGQHTVSSSERMANPCDETSTLMCTVTIPSQTQNLPMYHKTLMTDFKIDYQVRRDNKGQDSVYKVYIPSQHKGWVIMAQKNDATSPRAAALQPDVSLSEIKAEKPSEEPQEPLAEDSHDVSEPKSGGRTRKARRDSEYRLMQLATLNSVSGVVLPSKLKPGQPPIKAPKWPMRDCVRVRTHHRKKECPICGDWFPKTDSVKRHFVTCVGRNGNPQGYYWNGALNNERRIGRELAEMYARWDGGGDQNTETSTTDESSSDDPRTMSYEPSESCSYSDASSTPTQALSSSLSHGRNDYAGASSQVRTQTNHGHEKDVVEILDEESADSAIDVPQVSKEGTAKIISRAAQDPPAKQPRNIQALTSVSRHGKQHDNMKRAWVLAIPTIAVQHESGANTIEANRHECIPGDSSAMQTPPKTAVLTQASPERRTTSNACSMPTPVTPGDFGASRPFVPSPSIVMTPLTSTAGYTSPYYHKHPNSIPSWPPAGVNKRQLPSGPPPLAQSSKRPRISPRPALPSIEVDLLQIKPAAGPIRQFVEQGPQKLPASAGGSALILSKYAPMFGEIMDGNHLGVRQSKGAGLRIDTKAAETGAPPMPKNEPTSDEKLVAEYFQTHKDFRRELDNLVEKLDTANKRADAAELRAQQAENEVYRANNAGFAKLKLSADNHQKELQRQQSLHHSLQARCNEMEQSIRWKDRWIEELKRELEQVK